MTISALLFLQATDHTAEGMKALEEERYDDAAAVFQKVLEGDAEDYGAHFHLALIHSLTGNRDEAVAGYEKVLALKPGLYEAELNLGILLLEGKAPARAAKVLGSAVETKPEEFRPIYYLAEALFESGDFAGAEPHYRKAAELKPNEAAAQLGLARTIVKQGRLAEAEGHYRRAAELNPRFKSALLELASLYEEKQQHEEAIAIYGRFPENAAVQERLGQMLLERGETENAIPRLQAAVRDSPTAANRYALAVAYVRRKELDKATPLLELALEEAPANFDLRMTYGRVLRDQRKFPLAAQEFLRAVQSRPDSREAWSELASMLILLENYPQALAALDKVEELGQETAAVHFFRAIILDKWQQYEPALLSYERFLELNRGANENEEFKARQRIKVIRKELSKR
ncbi:MAG: tetratricopeptide repeat protein [bacterium]|nr:tetratricopeptide repeat protein [bacterium]